MPAPLPPDDVPHAPDEGTEEVGHMHADVAGGRLRAATFGAMDGLVTNISLVAGVGAAGAAGQTIILSGVSGLVAGAFSMALGEYTSVTTQNEQVDAEVVVEHRELAKHPRAELEELIDLFVSLGMRKETAVAAAAEIHLDSDKAVNLHLTHELGLNPNDQPSPVVAAVSSFLMFSLGAIIPLITYLLGFEALPPALIVGAVGLLVAGGLAARFTSQLIWKGALRQLMFGAIAAGATYFVGYLIGVPEAG